MNQPERAKKLGDNASRHIDIHACLRSQNPITLNQQVSGSSPDALTKENQSLSALLLQLYEKLNSRVGNWAGNNLQLLQRNGRLLGVLLAAFISAQYLVSLSQHFHLSHGSFGAEA